ITTSTEKSGKIETPAAGPIEPAEVINAETFQLNRGEVSVSLTNNLVINDFKNPQAAFKFEDTVGSKNPLAVEFDFGQGFTKVNFAKVEENRFFNAANELTLVTSIDEQGVANFNLTSP